MIALWSGHIPLVSTVSSGLSLCRSRCIPDGITESSWFSRVLSRGGGGGGGGPPPPPPPQIWCNLRILDFLTSGEQTNQQSPLERNRNISKLTVLTFDGATPNGGLLAQQKPRSFSHVRNGQIRSHLFVFSLVVCGSLQSIVCR